MRYYQSMEVLFSRGIIDLYYEVIYVAAHENDFYSSHFYKRFELRILFDVGTQVLNRNMKKFGAVLIGEGHHKYFAFDPKNTVGKEKAKEYLESLIIVRLLQQNT